MKSLMWCWVVSLVALAGCGKSDEGLAKRAGSAVGETVTDFASGVGKGVDKQMAVKAELSKTLADRGISTTIAKSLGINHPDGKGISVYLIAEKPFKATLIARALTKEGLEIGRSTADVELAAEEAKYVTFNFDREMDTQLVDRYPIDAKK